MEYIVVGRLHRTHRGPMPGATPFGQSSRLADMQAVRAVDALSGDLSFRPPDEFETYPDWVPGKDKRWRTTPTILKTLGIDGFDHSAS